MLRRLLVAMALAGFASTLVVVVPVGAQTQAGREGAPTYKVPRLPDGHPDFQGFWNNTTYTPLERPKGIDREFFTKEEVIEQMKRAAAEEGEQTTPGTIADVHYDFTQFGLDKSQAPLALNLRTSLIVDHRRRAEPAAVGALHPDGPRRAADARRRVQQQLSDCAGA
jgi:hypothetical protein